MSNVLTNGQRGMLLTPAELRHMRASLEGVTLPDECVIQEATRTPDGQGGNPETWEAAGTVVCRLDAGGGSKASVGQALQAFATYTLTVPHDTAITTLNRVVHDGTTYTVTAVDVDKSWPISKRVTLEQL